MRAVMLSLAMLVARQPLAAQEYSTAPLERSAVRTGVVATAIPVVMGSVLMGTADDDGIPILIAELGIVFGPMMGYQEAGLSGRGWAGAGLRTGLVLASFMGAIAVCWDCSKDEERAAWMVLIGGNALAAASAIYDLARLPHNIRRHDTQRRVGIAPFFVPGERRVGLRGYFTISSRGLGR